MYMVMMMRMMMMVFPHRVKCPFSTVSGLDHIQHGCRPFDHENRINFATTLKKGCDAGIRTGTQRIILAFSFFFFYLFLPFHLPSPTHSRIPLSHTVTLTHTRTHTHTPLTQFIP